MCRPRPVGRLAALVLVAFTLIQSGTSASAQPAQLPVREFVRQTWFEGIPYDEAVKYRGQPAAIDILLSMLSNPSERETWPNVVGVLGAIGDERAGRALLAFLEAEPAGPMSRSEFRARLTVPLALGQIVHTTHAVSLLDYLARGSDPATWEAKKLKWGAAFTSSPKDRDVILALAALAGLALAGTDESRITLEQLQQRVPSGVPETWRQRFVASVGQALATHKEVSAGGLSAYYKRHK